jgi:excisionase family DNA binding protein
MDGTMQKTKRFVDLPIAEAQEPYVTPEEAANFLHISPVTVRKMARAGYLPAHPIGNGLRKRWRFRISELASHMSSHVNSELSSVRDLRRKSS